MTTSQWGYIEGAGTFVGLYLACAFVYYWWMGRR